jgi:hypothetical protein
MKLEINCPEIELNSVAKLPRITKSFTRAQASKDSQASQE